MTPNDDVLVESLGSHIVMDQRRKGIEVVETTSLDYTFNTLKGKGKTEVKWKLEWENKSLFVFLRISKT